MATNASDFRDLPIALIDVSEFNTRKDIADGQQDSTIEDLASSIARQGLLNPITVVARPNGRFAVVAGQRRFLACRSLGWRVIPAVVRDDLTGADATVLSLIENIHRADMNPRDKARAFGALMGTLGDTTAVSRQTGVSTRTIRKYLQLLDLSAELQEKLAAGEVKNTEALARLAHDVPDPDQQLAVWDRIGGFTQDVQQDIIRRVTPDLTNLDDLVDRATEGQFGYTMVRNCPFDCPAIPDRLKRRVADMVAADGEAGPAQARLF